jgi:hypothetical protein
MIAGWFRIRNQYMHGGPLADLRHEADPDLPAFFLDRLARLVDRQASSTNLAERTTLGLATLSTLLDCLDLGCDQQALAIVEQVRDEMDLGEYVLV